MDFVPGESIGEAIIQEQGRADDATIRVRITRWKPAPPIYPAALGRAMDEAAGLIPLPASPPAERAVLPLPWSTYAALLRGL